MLQPGEGPTHYCYGATTAGMTVWNPRCLPLFLVRNTFAFGVTVSEGRAPSPLLCTMPPSKRGGGQMTIFPLPLDALKRGSYDPPPPLLEQFSTRQVPPPRLH